MNWVPSEAEPPPRLDATTWWTLAACAAFLAALGVVGMLPAMLLFLVMVGRLWGETRWGVLLATGAGLVVAIWLVFVRLFRLTLPRGLLGEWLFG